MELQIFIGLFQLLLCYITYSHGRTSHTSAAGPGKVTWQTISNPTNLPSKGLFQVLLPVMEATYMKKNTNKKSLIALPSTHNFGTQL